MEEDSREEDFNRHIRHSLCEWFGPFDEFHERVAKNQQTTRHGLIRSKMKPRPIPTVTLQLPPPESPSHIPVQVALQSMKNLVDEPLSALPTTFDDLKNMKKTVNNGKSSDNNKKRKMEEVDGENQTDVKRKKEAANMRNSTTPDSGVHSTESDQPEEPNSDEVAAMLNIMKTLDEPKLSPIPENFLTSLKAVEPKKLQKAMSYQSDSPMSSASTSREPTPEAVVQGTMRLKGLKPARVQKLLDLAKAQGKLLENGDAGKKEKIPEKIQEKVVEKVKEKEREKRENSKEKHRSDRDKEKDRSREKPREKERPKEKPEEKSREKPREKSIEKPRQEPKPSTSSLPPPPPRPPLFVKDTTPLRDARIQSLQNPATRNHHQSPSGPSPRKPMTPVQSRPGSSLSVTDPPAHHVEVAATTSKSMRWACQWDHKKMKTVQRVPIPDPTTSKQTKSDFYHGLAKEWKGKADKSKDKALRPMYYIVSSLYFVLEEQSKMEKERTPAAKNRFISMCKELHELLGLVVFQGVREPGDVIAVHILPRVKIVGQIMMAFLQYQLYMMKSEQTIKNLSRLEWPEVVETIEVRQKAPSSSKHPQSTTPAPVAPGDTPKSVPSAGSTPSEPTGVPVHPWITSVLACPSTVTMPQVVFDSYRFQLRLASALMKASRYWEDSKHLARHVDATFIKDIETICGKSIGMDMSLDVLAQFVLTAVASLTAEYEEEQRQPVKPTMDKVRPALDYSIRNGGAFFSDLPPRPSHPESSKSRH